MEPQVKASPNVVSHDREGLYRFLVPSLIGILLFLLPIKFNGEVTIGVGILAVFFQDLIGDYMAPFILGVLSISLVMSLIGMIAKPAFIMERPFLKQMFHVGAVSLGVRFLGLMIGLMTFYKIGPEFIWSDNTGGVVLYGLAPVLMTWFFFAGLLLPLLVEFGLMEFVGAFVSKVMRPVFKLPGRSSIDCLASWMGAGTVGVLVTTKQFDEGYYTRREAAVIATTFSIASVAFSLVVVNVVGLGHMFLPFYLTVSAACIVAAIIMPRIPPLSRKEDTYYEPAGKQIDETIPEGVTSFQWGMQQALDKANKTKSASQLIKSGLETVADIWLGLIPLVMSLGALALIVAEYTSFFNIISYPIVPILELMQLPEADAAAQTMLVGFADMFLPAVIGSGIESELTRFVVAGVSLTQLIYMSEIGILILRSNIPLSFLELFIIFVQRTVITLPVIVLIAHLFVF
ncbi:nucleoside recognition membrane protein YjiH [Bacillus ectoiniformans]|uniref:YjiH family protein n=1 Tax=Bacillus ectoiniformans TaxID=1494429 RepID=UPI0019590086|nr:YjiH family protein [Bacillus ectoiniformans]MBM7649523.1 nucleoside recognition membrane protein YjiH [Bacillus ectoiniformans]